MMMPSSSATTTRGITLTPDTSSPITLTPASPEESGQLLGQIDQTTGAPLRLRAAMASVRRPAQKLEILRRVDPNAQPYGRDNFVYTPPGSTFPVLVDPPGGGLKERGKDIVEAFPFLAELAGSVAGGIGGAAVGPVGAVVGAGAGGMALRARAEQAMMQAGGIQDPRSVGQLAGDMGTTAAVSAIGEGTGRLAAPAGRFLGKAVEETPFAIATREAARRLNVPITAGMETGRRFLRNVEASLASNPVTFGIMGKSWQDATTAAAQASRMIVRDIARGSDTHPGSFGDAINAAAKARVDRVMQVRTAMDNTIGSLIPESTMMPLTHTQQALQALLDYQSKAPQSLGPEVSGAIGYAQRLLADAEQNGGMIPFDVMRRLRTTIGEAAQFGPDGERVAGSSQHLQQLYGALKDDIRAGAKMVDDQALAAGLPTPGAEQAVELHDEFVRLNRDPANPVGLKAMEKLMTVNPGNPTQWAVTLVRSPEKAKALRAALQPEEWDQIAGSIFEDMGRAKPGAQGIEGDTWSPETFLTNWNRLRDRGREALFGGTRYAGVSRDIDALARIADTMKESAKLGNTSNTARALLVPLLAKTVGGIGLVAGSGMAAGSRVGGLAGTSLILGSYSAAKILTSPRVMNVIRMGVQGGLTKGPSVLARLAAIGRADPALQGAINEYIAAAGAAGYPIPDASAYVGLNTGQPGVQFTPR